MSEPVGNEPRSGVSPAAIPGNSHREREATTSKAIKSPEPEREKVDQIITGKVVTRKPALWKRIARSMIAEDIQNVNDFVLSDIIGPAIKNLIRDVIVGGTERTLYGSTRNARVGTTSMLGRLDARGNLRTQYDKISAEPTRRLSDRARARHDFNEIVLETRGECIEAIDALGDLIARYHSVSVADLYDLLGTTGSYADRGWGWTDLSTARVQQVRGGYLLDLPMPEPLRN